MLAEAVHHVSLCVNDLLDFYCGLLGLSKIERPEFGLEGAWLEAGNAQIHLIVAPDGVDTGRPPGTLSPVANHRSATVSDYQKTLDEPSASGLKVFTTSPEVGQLWVTDPSGQIIEFITRR